ncbi:MAG: polysaccharide biosynthesis C-terminal domain-containing protein, partial [Lachnospiraceae bacterium]|nr:polysaccharide biosynthesis C-terminal domain-containing protein [Lachnospiraceae bacterium]
PMQIILPTVLMIGLTNILGIQILVPLGKEKIVLYSEIAGGIVDVIINALLIPKYSADGAAVGTLAAEIIVFLVQYGSLRSEVGDAFRKISYQKIAAALLAAVGVSITVKRLHYGNFILLTVSAFLFFGVYVSVLLLLKERLMSEIFANIYDKVSTISVAAVSAIDSKVSDGMRRFSENFFMFVMTAYILFIGFKNTMFALPFPDNMYTLMMIPMLIAVVFQWITHIKSLWRVAAGAFVVLLYGLVYVVNRNEFSGYGHMVLLAFMTAGCIGMEYNKILKHWIYVVGAVILITFAAASIGAAENLVYYAGGRRLTLRGALGVCYPTDCAAWICFYMMILWVAFKKIPDIVMIAIAFTGYGFVRVYCDGKCSALCILLFIAVIAYRIFEDKIIEKRGVLKWVKKVTDLLVYISVPTGAAAMTILAYMYGKEKHIAVKIDDKIDKRVGLSWAAIKEYGFKPFGTNFDMSGAGQSIVGDWNKYNYLDSSYINILIRYGYILAIVLLVMWFFVIRKAIRLNDRRMLLVMAVIAVHSFEEQHFAEFLYNPMVAMFLCDFVKSDDKPYTMGDLRRLKGKIGYFAGAAATVVAAVCLPKIFAIYRTVVDILEVKNSSLMTTIAFVMIVLLFAAVIMIVYGISCITEAFTKKRNIGKAHKTVLISGIALAVLPMFIGLFFISSSRAVYAERVESDKAAIDIIRQNKTHPVYVNDYPKAYMDTYKGLFSDSIWSEEDLARYHRATVLFDKNHDSSCFFNRGYMYAQISEYSGVYTNDDAVVAALEESGYHITGYYSSKKDIAVDEDGNIEDTMLLNGKYIVNAGIKLEKSDPEAVGKVGTINFTAYSTDTVIASRDIMYSDFDENGEAYLDITMNLGRGVPVLKYAMLPSEGNDLRLISCTYVKRPDRDVHSFYNESYQVIRSEYYDADGNRITAGSGESACEYEYDKKRNTTVIRYYGIDDKPLIISAGYAEIHREYNDLRFVIKESYYGTDGKPIALGDGHASDTRIVDVKGCILDQKYFDVDGNPVMLTSGYAELKREYDGKKRVTREEYRDINGELINLTNGYAAIEKDYDDNDNVIAQRYFGSDDKHAMTIWGYAEIHRVYDDLNRIIEESYFNADGDPVITTSGYAEIHREYDAMNRIVAESYYGTDGNPIALTAGQASEKRVYNQNGNLIAQKYYGTDGQPRLMTWGYAEIHKAYNGKNQVIREEYFGTDGNPIELSNGQAAVETEYDDSGTPNVLRYYGADGNLKITNSGYAEIRREYNDLRQLVAESYYGTDEQPVALASGQASDNRGYDGAGNMTYQKFFDVSGNAVVITNGYAEIHREFNAKKQVVAESYFGTDGNPIALGSGQASDTRELDDRGNCIVQKYFDVSGNSVIITSGFAEIHRVFNDKNQVTREEYYGTDGALMAVPTGQASVDRENDAVGNVLTYKYYDVSGNMVMTTWGYAELHRTYNDKRQITGESYYGTDGNLIALGSGQASDTRELDERGNCVVQKYYGVSGNLILRTDGFAEIHRVFNAQNKVTNEQYFGLNGEPVENSSGFASKDIEYDDKGNYVSEKHYNLSGELV